MGKCQPCQENKCEQSYANRSVCEGGDCTCICQESGIATFWKAVGSISVGAACVAGGVGITILSAGFGAPLGGAIIGAGSSLITAPIAKKLTGEYISGGELLTDVGIGATVGALSGGIGAGGSALSQGASGLVKFGVRAGAGAAAGAVGGAVTETARAIQGEEVSLGSYGKSMGIGLACGTIGGASSHLASNASKGVSSGIAKAATRIAVQTGTATATDAGIQLYETGGDFSQIDGKRLLVTATSQLTVATTAECASSVTLKTNLYKDELNQMRIENEHQEGLNKKAENLDRIKTRLEDLKTHKAKLRNIQMDKTATPQEKIERIQRYRDDNKLGTSKSITKRVNQRIAKLERQIGPNKPNYEQAATQKAAATQRPLPQANKSPQEVIKEKTQKVQQDNKLNSEIQELRNHKLKIENIRADRNPDLNPREKRQMEQKYPADQKLESELKRVNERITKLEAKLGNVEPSKIGKDMSVYADQSATHDYDKKLGQNQNYEPVKDQVKAVLVNKICDVVKILAENVQVGAGAAAAGAVSGAVTVTARKIQGEEVSLKSYGNKSIGNGLACGSTGEASSHLASNVSKGVSSGIAKAATRIENELQEGLNKKNLDGIKTKLKDLKAHKAELINIQNDKTATPQEKQERIQRYRDDNKLGTSKSIIKKINQRIAKLERKVDPNYKQAAVREEAAAQRLHQANRLPPEVIKEETQKVQQYNKLSSKIQELQNHKSNIENIRADPNPDLTLRDKHQMEQKYLADNELGNGLKRVNEKIAKLEAKLVHVEPSKIGKDNLHFLTGDRTGQSAMDVPDENGNIARHRIIADHDHRDQ